MVTSYIDVKGKLCSKAKNSHNLGFLDCVGAATSGGSDGLVKFSSLSVSNTIQKSNRPASFEWPPLNHFQTTGPMGMISLLDPPHLDTENTSHELELEN
jgi:hypothetical protein